MQNKLQELTEKLYSEGLSKGREEAGQIIANARKEAEQIVLKAKEESAQIIATAVKEADDVKERVLNEVKMSSRQSYSSLKHEIEGIITEKALEKPVYDAMSDTALIKSIIQAVVSAFNPDSDKSTDLIMILPEKMKAELDLFIRQNIAGQLKGGIEIKFDKKMSAGFKIGPKGDGYYVSFTDKDFKELIGAYLRPKIREIIFAE